MGGGVKILFISDVHLGYDVETNLTLVNKIVKITKPELVLSGGDWDIDIEVIKNGLTREKFMKMFNNVPIYSILGNHDNETGKLSEFINNLTNSDGSRVFFEGLIEVYGLKILGKSIYFNSDSIGEFIRWVVQNRDTQPDFLILHECPNRDINMMDYIISVIKPRIILCGHIHDESFYHKEYNVFIKSRDSLCAGKYESLTVDLFKVITYSPFCGYAVIDYNPDSRELLGFTLSRFR